MKFLITATTEVYQWVEADSKEEALTKMEKNLWSPTMNQSIQNIEVKRMGNELPPGVPEFLS